MKMLKKVKKPKLSVRNCEILVGLFVFGKGIWLLHDSHYFVFPPQFANIENSRAVDVLLILIGLLQIVSAFFVPYMKDDFTRQRLIAFSKVMLVAIGVVCMVLALLQIIHGFFTPFFRMGHNAWGDLIIFGLVYLTACDA